MENNLDKITKTIKKCKKCRLWKFSANAVPGCGPDDSSVMLIGQNPGKEENNTGKPFVGRSGRFLDETLEKNNINRKDIFITSVVKHATPKNRKPKEDEVAACYPYLEEQIKEIKPKIVLLMGNVAKSIQRAKNIRYIETYHPAAAMRFPKI
ncbi:MAG: uracil-DNA glycosylase, partial [Candidatus Woesearchaeota archaeon]